MGPERVMRAFQAAAGRTEKGGPGVGALGKRPVAWWCLCSRKTAIRARDLTPYRNGGRSDQRDKRPGAGPGARLGLRLHRGVPRSAVIRPSVPLL